MRSRMESAINIHRAECPPSLIRGDFTHHNVRYATPSFIEDLNPECPVYATIRRRTHRAGVARLSAR